MKTFLRLLGSQLPGLALGLVGGVFLMYAHLEDRWDARMDARLGELRGLCAARPATVTAVAPAVDTRGDLRLLRDQVALLTARLAQTPAPAESTRPTPEAPAVATVEQESAVVQGRQVLDEALQRGRWTEEDSARFRMATQAATREDVEALEHSLSAAINGGRLHPVLGDGR